MTSESHVNQSGEVDQRAVIIRREFIKSILIIISMIILGFSYCRYRFSSVQAALDYVSGDRLLIDQKIKSIGVMATGSTQNIKFNITNYTGHSVRLIGSTSSCLCAVVGELPEALPNSETRTIQVRISSPSKDSNMSGKVRIFTDDTQYPELVMAFTGHTAEP